MSHSSFNSSSHSEHERSASRDPSTSLSPPSAELSDNSSRVRPPIRVSEESAEQHYYVVPNSESSLSSKDKAPVSGGTVASFTCRGLGLSYRSVTWPGLVRSMTLPGRFAFSYQRSQWTPVSKARGLLPCRRTLDRKSVV